MRLNKILMMTPLLLPCSAAFAQVAADITANIEGTYELTYDFATSDSPFANGDMTTFVINAADDTLCVDGKQLSDPYHRAAGETEALWDDADISYATTLGLAEFNEINVYKDGTWVGQFTGSKSSDATDCSGGSATSTLSISTEAETMFDLAAELYPQLFANGSALRQYQNIVYRYFAGSGVYVGIRDGRVLVLGGPFGASLRTGGTVSKLVNALQAEKAKQDTPSNSNDNTNNGNTDVDISGVYDLTISGKIATVVGGFTAPPVDFSLQIQDIVAPDPGDTDEVTNVITETLSNVSGISEIQVVVTNNTESRITFSVSFSATQNGVNVEMDLEYDYVK